MKLRPYHNPEGVDESKVPDGWRFLYADEAGRVQLKPCRGWHPCRRWRGGTTCGQSFFSKYEQWEGNLPNITYIVPVNS